MKKIISKILLVFAALLSVSCSGASKWNDKGLEDYAKGNYDAAIGSFQKALEADPDNDKTYYNLGMVYFAKGNFDLANKNYQKAAKLGNDDAQKHLKDRNLSW